MAVINNQLSFRHVVGNKYLPTSVLKRSVLDSSNYLIENNLYPNKNSKTAYLNLKKIVSPILFFCDFDSLHILMLYEYNFFEVK